MRRKKLIVGIVILVIAIMVVIVGISEWTKPKEEVITVPVHIVDTTFYMERGEYKDIYFKLSEDHIRQIILNYNYDYIDITDVILRVDVYADGKVSVDLNTYCTGKNFAALLGEGSVIKTSYDLDYACWRLGQYSLRIHNLDPAPDNVKVYAELIYTVHLKYR